MLNERTVIFPKISSKNIDKAVGIMYICRKYNARKSVKPLDSVANDYESMTRRRAEKSVL